MVIGLDDVERRVQTINPDTLLLEQYVCGGYYNTGRFIKNPIEGKPDILIPGKLIDWYRPISRKGDYHSLEFLELCAKKYDRPISILYKGQWSEDEQPKN